MRRLALLGLFVVPCLLPAAVVVGASSLYAPYGRGGGSSSVDVGAGEIAFRQFCAGCHSLDERRSSAPSLRAIGSEAAQRRPGYTAAQYILESIVVPGAFRKPGVEGAMPRVADDLDDATIRSLVGFLASRGGRADFAEIEALPIVRPAVSAEASAPANQARIRQGEILFHNKGKCATCHQRFNPLAPSLEGVGQHGTDYLREKILEPSKTLAPAYAQTTVATRDGRVLLGRLLQLDHRQVALLTADEAGRTQVRQIPVADLDTGPDGRPALLRSGQSAMPSYRGVLTDAELDCLVHFLVHLR